MITRKRFVLTFNVDMDDQFPTTNLDLILEAYLNDNFENVKVVKCEEVAE